MIVFNAESYRVAKDSDVAQKVGRGEERVAAMPGTEGGSKYFFYLLLPPRYPVTACSGGYHVQTGSEVDRVYVSA